MRTKVLISASAAVGMAVGVLFMPTAVQAWPWDSDDQQITVGGYAFCTGFNFDAPAGSDHAGNLARAFSPLVEDFTIRGRSDIVKSGTPMRYEYEITVPSGWVVEWSLDCEGAERTHGSFKVDSSVVGTHQTRHICSQKIGLSPCRPPEYAGCALLFVNGTISLPVGKDFGETLGGLANAAKNGYGVDDALANPKACLDALAADSGVKRSAQAPPKAPAPADELPAPAAAPAEPLTPLPAQEAPAAPPAAATPAQAQPQPAAQQAQAQAPVKPQPPTKSQPPTQPQSEPEPQPESATVRIRANGCNTYGQNCDGNPIYLDVPPPGYNWKTQPKRGTVPNGTELTAECWAQGGRTTNYAESDPGPAPYGSDVYYYVQVPGSADWGYIPDTYSARHANGHAGLPHC